MEYSISLTIPSVCNPNGLYHRQQGETRPPANGLPDPPLLTSVDPRLQVLSDSSDLSGRSGIYQKHGAPHT